MGASESKHSCLTRSRGIHEAGVNKQQWVLQIILRRNLSGGIQKSTETCMLSERHFMPLLPEALFLVCYTRPETIVSRKFLGPFKARTLSRMVEPLIL